MTTVSVLLRSAQREHIGVLIIRLNYNTTVRTRERCPKTPGNRMRTLTLKLRQFRLPVSSVIFSPPVIPNGQVYERDVCQYIQCAITASVSDYVPDPGSMNSSNERACTHTHAHVLVHTHVADRRRLKRSPTSIVLAINALSASVSSFCLFSMERTIPHYRRRHAPHLALLLIPRFSLFHEREWVLLFLASQRERVLFYVPLFPIIHQTFAFGFF